MIINLPTEITLSWRSVFSTPSLSIIIIIIIIIVIIVVVVIISDVGNTDRPWGSLIAGISAEAKAIIMIIIIVVVVIVIISSSLEDSKVRVLVEMSFACW